MTAFILAFSHCCEIPTASVTIPTTPMNLLIIFISKNKYQNKLWSMWRRWRCSSVTTRQREGSRELITVTVEHCTVETSRSHAVDWRRENIVRHSSVRRRSKLWFVTVWKRHGISAATHASANQCFVSATRQTPNTGLFISNFNA